MEKLKALAADLGVNIDKAFNAKKPEEFKSAVDKLNAAMGCASQKPATMAQAQYKTKADMQLEAQQAVDVGST